jgi:hypothetical protein
MDKVKNFCNHSMILSEMTANRKPNRDTLTPPPPCIVNITGIKRKSGVVINFSHLVRRTSHTIILPD